MTASADAGPEALESTTWLLVGAVVDGNPVGVPQPPGTSEFQSYTALYSKGQLVANDGCNTFVNAETIGEHSVAHPGDGVSGTAVGCPDTTLRDAYDSEIIRGSAAWAVTGGQLTLTSPSGDVFDYEPFPAGYPSDLAGVKHATTAEKSVDGVRFRIYALPASAVDRCFTMEFDEPGGTPWDPITDCSEDLTARQLIGPGIVSWLPDGTASLFAAVPANSVSRAVFRPNGKGHPVDLSRSHVPGTAWDVFIAFLKASEHGSVTFYDSKDQAYSDLWKITE